MNHYAQNNFNQSPIAQDKGSNKALIIVTGVVLAAMFAAFKFAIGG